MKKKNSLTKEERLLQPSEFKRVFDAQGVGRGKWLVIFVLKNDLGLNRLGVVVSRKHGKSHRRNRIKRLFREAFRLNKTAIPAGHDLILLPRSIPEDTPFSAIEQDLLRLLAGRFAL